MAGTGRLFLLFLLIAAVFFSGLLVGTTFLNEHHARKAERLKHAATPWERLTKQVKSKVARALPELGKLRHKLSKVASRRAAVDLGSAGDDDDDAARAAVDDDVSIQIASVKRKGTKGKKKRRAAKQPKAVVVPKAKAVVTVGEDDEEDDDDAVEDEGDSNAVVPAVNAAAPVVPVAALAPDAASPAVAVAAPAAPAAPPAPLVVGGGAGPHATSIRMYGDNYAVVEGAPLDADDIRCGLMGEGDALVGECGNMGGGGAGRYYGCYSCIGLDCAVVVHGEAV